MKSFKDYLRQIHAEQYEGLDDEMPDDFDNWFSNLDAQEMFDYANAWVVELLEEIKKDVRDMGNTLN